MRRTLLERLLSSNDSLGAAARRVVSSASGKLFAADGRLLETKSVLSLAEEAELEELLRSLKDLGIRKGETIRDDRRGKLAFQLASEATEFCSRLVDKYEGEEGYSSAELVMLGKLATEALDAGRRFYEQAGYMITEEEFVRRNRRRADAEIGPKNDVEAGPGK